MKTYIQITGGRGPVECTRTVALVAREMQKEYPDLELVDYEEHNTNPGCFMSMTLSTNSDNVSQMKDEWEGTVQWIATKNHFRPNHKRKNWFVSVHFFNETAIIKIDDRDIKYETSRSGGVGGQNVNKVKQSRFLYMKCIDIIRQLLCHHNIIVEFDEQYNPRHTYRIEKCIKCGKIIYKRKLQ